MSARGAERDVLVREGVGRMWQGRMDVFAFEVRMRRQKRLLVSAFSDLANDQLHSDTGPHE